LLYDVIIIGSGPSGLTAAIYTSRAFLKTLVLSGNKKGGQLMDTTSVDNFPGFPEGVMGPDLMMKMEIQAKKFGTEIISDEVSEINLPSPAIASTTASFTINNKYQAKSIIIATGASHKKLEIQNEEKFWGHGVSYCATCDAFFFRNKAVGVVGGGDTAMEEANFISKFASKVYLIHRREEFKASKIMLDKVKNNPKIEIITNRTVSKLSGSPVLKNITLKSTTNEKDMELPVDGLFVAIGLKPNTDFLKGIVNLDKKGYIIRPTTDYVLRTTYSHMTSVNGIFVAGDVSDPIYRQAITSAGDGCAAALEVEKYLGENK
jgi:thioredoxin reductase (NADPH)